MQTYSKVNIQETVLLQQGTQIAVAMSRQGYLCRRMTGGDLISWEITRADEDWWVMLTYIPRPAEQWRILPPSSYDPHQPKLYRIIEQTIGGRR
jgi:hypothetical protein